MDGGRASMAGELHKPSRRPILISSVFDPLAPKRMKKHYERNSRRDFLKTAALGAAAASLGVAPTRAAVVRPPQLEKKLGVALVGLGYYSTQLLAPALQETKNVALTGIVTGTPEKAASWKEQYDIPDENIYDYDTFDDIARNDAIDIVYVVLPNSMHAEYSIRASRAGKHVICEKPMALDVRECEAMIAAAAEAGKGLSVGYRTQYDPAVQEAMRLGQEQILGPMRLVVAGAGFRIGENPHWKISREYGGGALMDMGVYSLQAGRYMTGEEPIAVTAQTFTTRPEVFTEVDETTLFQLEFPSGALANLQTSFGFGMNYMQANAARGFVRLEPFQAYRDIRGESSQGPIPPAGVNQQAAQMDEDAYNMANGLPVRVPGEEGLLDMRVVEAVRQSIRDGGRRVTLAPYAG